MKNVSHRFVQYPSGISWAVPFLASLLLLASELLADESQSQVLTAISGSSLRQVPAGMVDESRSRERFHLSELPLRDGLEVALDELFSPRENRRIPIDRCSSLEELCQVADHLGQGVGDERRPVLYPAGVRSDERLARYATSRILVKLKPGAHGNQVARQSRLRRVDNAEVPAGYVMLEAATPAQSLIRLKDVLMADGVDGADLQTARQAAKRFIPNDPLFPIQWHLLNARSDPFGVSLDNSLTNVWERFRGRGITVAIIDDGLQHAHPDLAPHYDAALSWDFNGGDSDPTPSAPGDAHGTACAGITAAAGNNRIGVSGVAFEANLAGFRLIAAPNTDSDEAGAFSRRNDAIDIKSNSWGPPDCPGGATLGLMGTLAREAIERGVREGRGGLGVIYTFAGGNGGDCDNSNYDAYANSIHTLAVGCVNDSALRASYSEKGANLTVVAPSGEFPSDPFREIVTTDLMGVWGYNDGSNAIGTEDPDINYTRNFNGTSAACPMISGVVALLLDAAPHLGWRDVKEVLMRTATVIQPSNPDWATNSAGIHHNHEFGGGLANAGGASELGQHWRPLGPMVSLAAQGTGLPQVIPDFNGVGVFSEFTITNQGFRVEHATLTLTAPHADWGDLEVYLISPGRIRSKLAEVHDGVSGFEYRNWTFSSTRHWGESAEGIWRLQVVDGRTNNVGRLESARLNLYGSQPGLDSFKVESTRNGVKIACATASPGWKCVIESSSDLASWAVLRTLVVADNGLAEMLDGRSRLPDTHNFYRARLIP